jgi:hypothetical protein
VGIQVNENKRKRKRKRKRERERVRRRRSIGGVVGDPALYVVILVNSHFFPKTCEINEKKRKKQMDSCTWSPL